MKYSPELENALIKLIRAGNYVQTACNAVGIDVSTLWRWLKKGEKALELKKQGKEISQDDEKFCNLYIAIKKAKAEAEVRNVTIIQTAAVKSWQAAAWWLERVKYERWGKKDKISVETPKPIKTEHIVKFQKELKILTPDEKRRFIEFAIKERKKLQENIDVNR